MSFQLMAWAVDQTTGSPTRKAVLLALANAANHQSRQCNPRVESIAEETELGTATVKRALKDLVDAGFITRTRRRRKDGSLGPYDYEFPTRSERADQGSQRSVARDQGDPLTRDHGDPAMNQELQNQETEPGNTLPAAPESKPYDPLVGVKVEVEGEARPQDLVWNALAQVIDTDETPHGSRMREAVRTIRSVTWEHATAATDDAGRERATARMLERIDMDPVAYEVATAELVVAVNRWLRDQSPGLTYGPEGFARNFRRGVIGMFTGGSTGRIGRIVEEALRASAR